MTLSFSGENLASEKGSQTRSCFFGYTEGKALLIVLVTWQLLNHERFTQVLQSWECFMTCSFTVNQALPF